MTDRSQARQSSIFREHHATYFPHDLKWTGTGCSVQPRCRDGRLDLLTGQMPTDPSDDSAPFPDGIEAQTRRVMDNLGLILAGLNLGLEHVVGARAYLTHFQEEYAAMNVVYASYFPADRRPARTCIGVTGLARNAKVEIDFVARRPGQRHGNKTALADDR